jgi:ferredoxin
VLIRADAEPEPRYALLGVRPCDLRAIGIADRVLGGGAGYAARREAAFIVAANCTEPGATCFCTSMGTGPQAGPGFDLVLTELTGEGQAHRFLVAAGSSAGSAILAELTSEPADARTEAMAASAVTHAADRMGRSMATDGLRDLMAASHQAARWEDVASRCLTCGNCTMVCPTCFCTTMEDATDLTGEHAERWQRWESCFGLDFSYLHGGSVRASPASRYRQWLTHKLGTWHDQFGSSGCVGCGRCIAWCPVGIDLTEEVAALRAEAAPGDGTGAGAP